MDWQNLSAVAAVVGMMVWGITKGVPNLIESFREEMATQRREFRDDLAAHRQQSAELAKSGHQAVERLAAAIENMADEVHDMKRTDDAQSHTA